MLKFLRTAPVRCWIWARFGHIHSRVVGTAGDHVPAEIEYRGQLNRLVGYWAYGSFDPAYPFHGYPGFHVLEGRTK